MSDLVRRREELSTWLEQAENAVHSLPVATTEKNLKELKVQRGSKQSKHGFISDPQINRFSHLYGQLQLCCIFLYSLFTLLKVVLCSSVTQKKTKKNSSQMWEKPNTHSFSFEQYFFFFLVFHTISFGGVVIALACQFNFVVFSFVPASVKY